MGQDKEKDWLDDVPRQAAGDMIIAEIGADARNVAVGEHIDLHPGTYSDRSTHVETGAITNAGGQIALGSALNQATGGSDGSTPAKTNTFLLAQLMTSRLQPGDLGLLTLQMHEYSKLKVDSAALGTDLLTGVRTLIQLCLDDQGMVALIQSLIDSTVLDANQAAWYQWAVLQDSR
jgi:hypothetical protein